MSLDLWSESKDMENYSIVNYDDEESNLAYVYTNAIWHIYHLQFQLSLPKILTSYIFYKNQILM